MALERLSRDNYVSQTGPKFRVYDYWYNLVVDKLNDISSNDGVLTADTLTLVTGSDIKSATTTLTVTEIVGTAAGDIGHAAGATLVAAPGATKVLEFLSAVLIYDYAGAAYTGGNNDLKIQNGDGAVALSTTIADADICGAAGDKIVFVNALSATDQALTANKPITLKGTAYTQPGAAAGVLRCKVFYREHLTGL